MGNFEDYVAQQAEQRARNAEAETERRNIAEIDAAAFKRRQTEVFQRDVMGPLNAAAKAIKQHVDAKSESELVAISHVGRLLIGSQHAPKKVSLSVLQRGTTYTLIVQGPIRSQDSEKTVAESDLAPELEAAIKDAVDRWFGTNEYQKG